MRGDDYLHIRFSAGDQAARALVAQSQNIEQARTNLQQAHFALLSSGFTGRFLQVYEGRVSHLLRETEIAYLELRELGQELGQFVERLRELDSRYAALFSVDGGEVGSASHSARPTVYTRVPTADGQYTGSRLYEADVLFVNGAFTDGSGHLNGLNDVQRVWGDKKVMGVYNATSGYLEDLAQCLGDLSQPGARGRLLENATVRELAAAIRAKLVQSDGTIEIVGHSQGAIITAAALHVLDGNVDLSRVHVTTFGGAGVDFPQGPAYDHYVFRSDPVPRAGVVGDFLVAADPLSAGNTTIAAAKTTYETLQRQANTHYLDGDPGWGTVEQLLKEHNIPSHDLDNYLAAYQQQYNNP